MMKIKASRQIYRRLKYKSDIFDTDNIFRLSKELLNDVGQSSISSTLSTSSLSTSSSRTSSMDLQDAASIAKHVHYNTDVNTLLIPCRNEYNVNDKVNMWYNDDDYKIFQNCQIKELKTIMRKKSLDLKNALQYLYISNEANDSDYYDEINICGNNIEIRRENFKILVVDTSLFECMEISKIIERSGHRCDYETRLGKLRHLDLDEYDLILFDLKMMNLDITALKRNFNTDIKFVGMASKYYDCDDSLSKEFDITIPKPLNKNKIQCVLNLLT